MKKAEKILNYCEVFAKLATNKDYMRDYMRARYHKVRDKIVDDLGGKCNICHSGRNLHLDHIDKKKKTIRMSDIHSVSDEKLQGELKNIQLLCWDCHKKKTKDSWDFGAPKPQHGTYWMYRKHGCRCGKCIAAYKAQHKAWNDAREKK